MSSLTQTNARRDILSSVAFRLTLRFALIFVTCLLVLNIGLGFAARWVVESQARSSVEALLDDLRETAGSGGVSAVSAAIDDIAGDLFEDGLVLGHQTADGLLLAGSIAVPEPQIGWSVFAPNGVDEDEALWVRSVRLEDGTWMNAAASSESFHDIGELMLAGAVWTVAIALPLAFLSGAMLSRAVLRRLTRIAETTEGVREGELSRRAPVTGSGDEFDRLAGNINAMLDTIEALTRNLRNVSVGIAHELRTPLARIRNRLVELKEPDSDASNAAAVADGALAEIDGALNTFDALLKIGQIEANAQRKGFETMRFSDLVAELAEVYEPVATEQGKHLTARVAPDVELRGNRALLAQMISNLLENAIEHTPPGTNITLELDATTRGQALIVEDDGPGIPAGESEHIFERFYRLERSRTSRGNGLGLSLVRSICSLHDFSIGLDPEAPGARFEIRI